MKKVLVCLMVGSLMVLLSACNFPKKEIVKVDSPNQVSNSENQSETGNNSEENNEKKENSKNEEKKDGNAEKPQAVKNITKKEAKEIAKELIGKDLKYSFLHTVCDFEYVDGDMSEFLTEAQLENYFCMQYKITCCSSIEQVKNHLLKYFHESRIESFPEEEFFEDDKGNIYVKTAPFGTGGYGEVTIVEYSNNKIIAKAGYNDVDGPTGGGTTFVIKKVNGNFILM